MAVKKKLPRAFLNNIYLKLVDRIINKNGKK